GATHPVCRGRPPARPGFRVSPVCRTRPGVIRGMRLLFVSWHCLDGTAEGLAAARMAGALARCGHEVTLLTREQSLAPEDPGLAVHRLEPETPGVLDRLTLDRWGRLGALPHLIRGCTVEEKGWVRAVAQKAAELETFDVLH